MLAASELKKRKTRTSRPQAQVPLKTRSWLERLPVELVQQVFLHALEVNMARASPFLGRTLSQEPIYKVLILFSFFDDDEQNPVEGKHFAPASYRLLSAEEKIRLQEGVLGSRWCTVSRIRRYIPILMRLVIVQEQREEWEGGGRDDAGNLLNKEADEPRRQPSSSRQALDITPLLHSYVDTSEAIAHDAAEGEDEGKLSIPIPGRCGRRGCLSVRCFPHRILSPVSWHHDPDLNNDSTSNTGHSSRAIDLLALLYRGWLSSGMHPPQLDHFALRHGIETAVRERSRPALDLLLQIHEQVATSQATGGGGGSGQGIHHLPPDIPVSTLHLATRQGSASEWILESLIRGLFKGRGIWILKDDAVLTRWAIDWLEKGSGFARWLLDAMEGWHEI